jgi:hypothetical protein
MFTGVKVCGQVVDGGDVLQVSQMDGWVDGVQRGVANSGA